MSAKRIALSLRHIQPATAEALGRGDGCVHRSPEFLRDFQQDGLVESDPFVSTQAVARDHGTSRPGARQRGELCVSSQWSLECAQIVPSFAQCSLYCVSARFPYPSLSIRSKKASVQKQNTVALRIVCGPTALSLVQSPVGNYR